MGGFFGREHPLPSEFYDLIKPPATHSLWDRITGQAATDREALLARISANPERTFLADVDPKTLYEEYHTQFSRHEIEEFYHYFASAFPSLAITRDRFVADNVASHGGSEDLWQFAFKVVDLLDDGVIDFREFVISIDRALNQTRFENLSSAFTLLSCGSEAITRPSALAFFSACARLESIPGGIGGIDEDDDGDIAGAAQPEMRVARLFQLLAAPNQRSIPRAQFISAASKRPFLMKLMRTNLEVDEADYQLRREVWQWEVESMTPQFRDHDRR